MTHASLTSTPESIASGGEDVGARSFESLRITGLTLAVAWHLLTLFAIAPQSAAFGIQGEPFYLQLSLYASAALTFLLLAIATQALQSRKAARHPLARMALLVDTLACLASALVFVSHSLTQTAQIVCFCALGVVDALFMMSATQASGFAGGRGGQHRNVIANAMLGSLAAFAVMFVIEPLSWAIFCLLPLGTYAMNRAGKLDAAERDMPSDPLAGSQGASGQVRGAIFHACAFGCALGLCQGAALFSSSDLGSSSLVASCGWIPVAGLLAAVMLYFTPPQRLERQGSCLVVRLGTSLMLIGILLATIMLAGGATAHPTGAAVLGALSTTFTLCGYCAYSLGFPAALLLSDASRSRAALCFGTNRFFCYASLAAGLAAGHAMAAGSLAGLENAPLVAVEAAGLIVCLASLPPFDRLLPSVEAKLGEIASRQAPDPAARPASADAPRAARAEEPSLAGGDLTPNSAGTYASNAGGEEGPAFEPARSDAAPTRMQAPHEEPRPARASEPEPEPADSPAEDAEQPAEENPLSPTEAIARDFNLSRREHEILCYLAHGRNAAFIQRELLISIYTVKTHIANIYGKIGAHSMQDVIDLVEQYSASPAGTIPRTSSKGRHAHAAHGESPSTRSAEKTGKNATQRHEAAEKDIS